MSRYLYALLFSLCFFSPEQVQASQNVEVKEDAEIQTPLKKIGQKLKFQEHIIPRIAIKPSDPKGAISDLQLEMQNCITKNAHTNISDIEKKYAEQIDLAFFQVEYCGQRFLRTLTPLCSFGACTLSGLALMPWFSRETSVTLQGISTILAFAATGFSVKSSHETRKREERFRSSIKKCTMTSQQSNA